MKECSKSRNNSYRYVTTESGSLRNLYVWVFLSDKVALYRCMGGSTTLSDIGYNWFKADMNS